VRYRDWASLLAVLCVVETIGADLAVRLENETVVASGLRGDAVLFGASLQSERGLPTLRQFTEILSDGDRDGIVTFEPRGGTPLRSFWVVIDLVTGERGLAVPPDYEVAHEELQRNALKHDASGLTSGLSQDRSRMIVLVVRPGEGAWVLAAADGSRNDKDQQHDGRVEVTFEQALAIGGDRKAPKHLKADDVIAVIDPVGMALRTVRITK
jgi:hypothetical protein